ncbi:hypothetical protein AB0D86_49005 [Streptomyces sp. NPDC048324]|uniref:hypothetical protein n=1 Tax=Streptomyces sp. NPDC048324 TaxID=3157205 RepID=UPI00341D4419
MPRNRYSVGAPATGPRFTRLSLDQGTTVILLGGCLSLGVLGAAKCLLNGERGRRNTAHLDAAASGGDVVAVTATRKIGGITDTPDLTTTEPLLLLTRDPAGAFTTRVDNTPATRAGSPPRWPDAASPYAPQAADGFLTNMEGMTH